MSDQKQFWTRYSLLAWMLFASLGLAGSARAQGELRVTAGLSTGIAKLGEAIQIVVTIEGSLNGSIGELPKVAGLVIGPAPNPQQRRQTLVSNGRIQEVVRTTWGIPVRPSVEGEYEIPPFRIEAAGTSYETPVMGLQVRKDMQGAELGMMNVEVTPSKIVVGQPFEVVVTFGWDQAIANQINYQDLSLPWWGQLPGAIDIEGSSARALGRDYAESRLNNNMLVEVERLAPTQGSGRTFETFQLRRSFLATTPGSVRIPTSHLAFGQRRNVGFFAPATPADLYYVAAEPLDLIVGTVPDEGRPAGFLDAVGSVSVRAEVDSREVNAGDSIKLRLEWTGDGNLEFFTLPNLAHMEGLDGINFYGATDVVKERGRRVSVFDLAPQSELVTMLPAIPLVLYNPLTESFETISSKEISIRVHALEGLGTLEDSAAAALADIRDIRTGEHPPEESARLPDPDFPWKSGGATGSILLVWLGLRRQVRKGGEPGAPLERRRRAARRALGRSLKAAQTSQERLHAFGAFLSARSGESDNAWIGRDLDPVLGDQADDGVMRLAATLDALDLAVWAPDATLGPSDGELQDVARMLVSSDLVQVAATLREAV